MIIHELNRFYKDPDPGKIKYGEEFSMDIKILITYAAHGRTTLHTAEKISMALNDHGLPADVLPIRSVQDIRNYSAVIIGGDIRFRQVNADMSAFIHNFQDELSRIPVAYFAVKNILGETTMDRMLDLRNALDQLCKQVDRVKPVTTGTFAHKVNIPEFLFPGRSEANAVLITENKAPGVETIKSWSESLISKLGLNPMMGRKPILPCPSRNSPENTILCRIF